VGCRAEGQGPEHLAGISANGPDTTLQHQAMHSSSTLSIGALEGLILMVEVSRCNHEMLGYY